MESALVVCSTEKGAAFFTDYLAEHFCSDIAVARGGEEAKRMLLERDFDVCLINAPLPNELGENLAISIAEKNICQVILVVRGEILDEVTEVVEDFGVITVGRPISKTLLWNALKLANVAQRRLSMMQKENDKLIQKIEDIKLVNRAKLLLITYQGMTEEEAHKYIERQAMDHRETRRNVAREILEMYENR